MSNVLALYGNSLLRFDCAAVFLIRRAAHFKTFGRRNGLMSQFFFHCGNENGRSFAHEA